ncbi:hypothetical protein OsJ_35573 [Oryza sativa Japonica Group]|uniref:Uncharacterized protein n=1 Tax=Oryza sativa subsp. japonica TaxID=39947 RepID=B9GCD4_ORYSJ|nr:hypothetical protein OsJ_35573 [Oryza sativa Japonica Group]
MTKMGVSASEAVGPMAAIAMYDRSVTQELDGDDDDCGGRSKCDDADEHNAMSIWEQNWIIEDGGDDFIISEEEWIANYNYATSRSGQASEHAYMVQFRQDTADQMWEDRQAHYGN